MTAEHEFQEGGEERCKWCGTSKAMFEAAPEQHLCIERPSEKASRPTRTGQSAGDFAADDADVISARIKELEAERTAAANKPDETD